MAATPWTEPISFGLYRDARPWNGRTTGTATLKRQKVKLTQIREPEPTRVTWRVLRLEESSPAGGSSPRKAASRRRPAKRKPA
jgi:hypothetical protein